MANFNTHLTVATSVSGALAIGLFFTDLVPPTAACLYWLLGTLGGILPDVDAPQSVPNRLLFRALGIFLACFFVISQLEQFFWYEFALLWIVIYFGVRYGLSKLFAQFTAHRGNFHSMLAALLFGFIAAAAAYRLLETSELLAWFAGLFVTVGYFVHLLLDELYSVDLANSKLKKSFGSALKIASIRHKFSTILLLLATLGVFQLTPSIDALVKIPSHLHIFAQSKSVL